MRTGGRHGRKSAHKVQVLTGESSLTHTLRAADVGSVARFAGAAEGAQSVDALTILAQVPHHTTLINIWTETRNVSSR